MNYWVFLFYHMKIKIVVRGKIKKPRVKLTLIGHGVVFYLRVGGSGLSAIPNLQSDHIVPPNLQSTFVLSDGVAGRSQGFNHRWQSHRSGDPVGNRRRSPPSLREVRQGAQSLFPGLGFRKVISVVRCFYQVQSFF